MPAKSFIALLLLLIIPLAATAHELHYRQIEHTAVVRAREQALFTATCGKGEQIMSGGYKILASELPIHDVVMVESRPVPQLRQWVVTLLYEPQAPAAVPVGEIKI